MSNGAYGKLGILTSNISNRPIADPEPDPYASSSMTIESFGRDGLGVDSIRRRFVDSSRGRAGCWRVAFERRCRRLPAGSF